VLFMILALGTLFDPQMPPQSPEASHYYQLGRAALSLDSPLEAQSVIVVQALVCHNLPHYNCRSTFLIVTSVTQLNVSLYAIRRDGRFSLGANGFGRKTDRTTWPPYVTSGCSKPRC
jgi:hypothetical protein